MRRFCDLVKSEKIKLVSVRKIILCIVVFSIILLGYSYLFEPVSNREWKQNAKEIKKAQEEAVEILQKESESVSSEDVKQYNNAIIICQNTIRVIEYCLNNNIVYNPANCWFFLDKTKFLLTGLIIFSVFIGSKSIGIENENRTWKNVFSSGNSSNYILGAKVFSVAILLAAMCLLFTVIALLIGLFRFGLNGNQLEIVEIVNGIIQRNNMLVYYLANLGVSLLKMYFCISAFFAVSLIGVGEKVALGVSLGIYLFSFISSNIIVGEKLNAILPFKYLGFKVTDIADKNSLYIFISVMLLYSVLFLGVSALGIRKKSRI